MHDLNRKLTVLHRIRAQGEAGRCARDPRKTAVCLPSYNGYLNALCDKLWSMLVTDFVMKSTAAGKLHHMIHSKDDDEVLFYSCLSESLHDDVGPR